MDEDILMEDIFLHDQEQERFSFKRDASGKHVCEAETTDSNSNDSSCESKEIDYNEEFESYFALFLNGRKVNPNSLSNQH